MRAQLSVEFLVYIALSSVSLLSMLYLYGRGAGMVSNEEGQASMAQFISEINSNMGYYKARFSAFIPPAICSSSVTPQSISFLNRTYSFVANVTLDMAYLCSRSGGAAMLNITRQQNGTFYVG